MAGDASEPKASEGEGLGDTLLARPLTLALPRSFPAPGEGGREPSPRSRGGETTPIQLPVGP
jgi:hypothetical protein